MMQMCNMGAEIRYAFVHLSVSCFQHDYRLRWLRGTVVERRCLTGELSLSHARPIADG